MSFETIRNMAVAATVAVILSHRVGPVRKLTGTGT